MEAARHSGWYCAGGFVLLSPFVPVFLWLAKIAEPYPFMMSSLYVATVILSMALLYCLIYGVWGLRLGFSEKHWNRFAESQDAITRELARLECIKAGVDIPAWLKE